MKQRIYHIIPDVQAFARRVHMDQIAVSCGYSARPSKVGNGANDIAANTEFHPLYIAQIVVAAITDKDADTQLIYGYNEKRNCAAEFDSIAAWTPINSPVSYTHLTLPTKRIV